MANRTYSGAGGVARRGTKKYAGIYTVLQKKYAFLDYIESSGTQYINTGVYPGGNALRIAIQFRYVSNHDGLSLFGNHTTSPYSLTVYGPVPKFYVGNTSQISCGPQTSLNVDYLLDAAVNNGTLTAIWNGTTYTAAYSGSLYTDQPIFVFGAANSSGNLAEAGSGYRLYSFRIYDHSVLVRDYVPAKRLSDGAVGLYDKVEENFYANAGTGAFAAGAETGEYLYDICQPDYLARIIARAYVGVGGVARRFWSRGEITYRGRAADISQPRGGMASASTARHALFGGGASNGTSGLKNTVDAYDTSYTRYAPEGLSVARSRLRGASVGQYALFGGGENENATCYATMDAYDGDLTKTAVTALTFAAGFPSAETVGGHAIYLGGYNGTTYYTTANAYDTTLTRSVISSASTGHANFPAARSKSHAVFAGGRNSFSTYTNVVDAYDGSLTRSTAQAMSVSGREWGASVSNGKSALFGGGYINSPSSPLRTDTVDAYDDSLTRTVAPTLSNTVVFNAAGRLDDFGLFFGGHNGSAWVKNAEAYDSSLTKTAAPALPEVKESCCAASVGPASSAPLLIYHGGYSQVYIYAIA